MPNKQRHHLHQQSLHQQIQDLHHHHHHHSSSTDKHHHQQINNRKQQRQQQRRDCERDCQQEQSMAKPPTETTTPTSGSNTNHQPANHRQPTSPPAPAPPAPPAVCPHLRPQPGRKHRQRSLPPVPRGAHQAGADAATRRTPPGCGAAPPSGARNVGSRDVVRRRHEGGVHDGPQSADGVHDLRGRRGVGLGSVEKTRERERERSREGKGSRNISVTKR